MGVMVAAGRGHGGGGVLSPSWSLRQESGCWSQDPPPHPAPGLRLQPSAAAELWVPPPASCPSPSTLTVSQMCSLSLPRQEDPPAQEAKDPVGGR